MLERARRPVAATAASVIALAAPLMLAHLTEPLIGLVDTAVIGRLGEVHLLGAVAIGAVLFDMLFWGLGSLRMSTAGLTAQAHGAGDDRDVALALARALALAVSLGVVLIVLQRPIMAATFALMDTSPAVDAAARAYIAIRIWSGPLALSNYAILGSLIGRGRTDLGLLLQVGLNLTKVAGTILFVPGLGWGIEGAAFATLLAEAIGLLGGVLLLRRIGGLPRGLAWGAIVEGPALRRMLAVNRDVAIRTVALLSAFAFFTAQGARAGDVALAANAVLYNLFLIGSYFLDGFATAAEQLCGQAVGARDERGFRRTVGLTLGLSLGVGAVVSAAAFVGGSAFIDAISTNEAVREAAKLYLPLAALTPLIGAAAFTFDGVYVGATWTAAMRNLMLAALAIYLAVFYGGVALAGAWTNAGLWIAFLVFLGVRGFGQWWLYPGLARRTFPTA
ncbi:MATE family efflux transporter [Alsobacter metallidurans]|uniref:MATE family efflux transporter n=1 Tax=Alsobacter metallidurans TaxID=340221 RepID=A0A917I4S9_9HYPH|nr:MATE family efflux transporter [Alsobacter metallidurans]GGH10288.1 MATE family efflux transporter [Alsobacter metallidurans]